MGHVCLQQSDYKQTNKLLGEQVIACFDDHLRTAKLLVFLDDNDDQRDCLGDCLNCGAARGFYWPVRTFKSWPCLTYVHEYVFVGNYDPFIDDFMMTLAHELQHCVQHREHRRFWAANTVAQNVINDLNVHQRRELGIDSWLDVPHEQDACLTAKQITEGLFGPARVAEYVEWKSNRPQTLTTKHVG